MDFAHSLPPSTINEWREHRALHEHFQHGKEDTVVFGSSICLLEPRKNIFKHNSMSFSFLQSHKKRCFLGTRCTYQRDGFLSGKEPFGDRSRCVAEVKDIAAVPQQMHKCVRGTCLCSFFLFVQRLVKRTPPSCSMCFISSFCFYFWQSYADFRVSQQQKFERTTLNKRFLDANCNSYIRS